MDSKHFPEFYRLNMKRVYRFLFYRVGGSKETAEDLTQDVFLKAFGAFEKYDPEISKSSWIFTIARNHLINHIAKQRPGVDLEGIENTIWDSVDWAEKLALRNDQKRLMAAIEQLSSDDAELVRLKYLEGWPYEEIAQKMQKNASALRVQAFRALKALRKILKQK